MKRFVTQILRKFRSGEAGSISVETLIIMPVVLWAFMAAVGFYDAFAARTASERAAYTVSDAIGRYTDRALTPEDIEGFNRVFSYIARSQPNTRMRVTSVYWHPGNQRHEVVWSYASNQGIPLTTETLTPQMLARLPELSTEDGDQARESIYITETRLAYVPIMERLPFVGTVIRSQVLEQFIVARPRYAPQLMFDDGTGVVGTTFPTCDDPGIICGTDTLGNMGVNN